MCNLSLGKVKVTRLCRRTLCYSSPGAWGGSDGALCAPMTVTNRLPSSRLRPVGAVAAVCAALSAGDTSRGGHAGPQHRLSGDFGPPDPQSRLDARERGDRGRDPDPEIRQCAQPQRALCLKRAFAIDIEVRRSCGGKLRVIASIEQPAVIERILEHLGRDAAPVDPAHACRAPPERDLLI